MGGIFKASCWNRLTSRVDLDDNNIFLNHSPLSKEDESCGLSCVCAQYTGAPVALGWLQVPALLLLENNKAAGAHEVLGWTLRAADRLVLVSLIFTGTVMVGF